MSADPTNQRILTAASREFARKGFYRTVVSDIARAAGVGKGTVYRRFGNKEQLFATLIKNGSDELKNRIEAAVCTGETPLESLESCLDGYFDFFRNSRELIEVVLTEGKQTVGRVSSELTQNDILIRSRLSSLFQSGMEQGVFRAQDAEGLAVLFHNTVWSLMRWAINFNRDIEFTRPLALDVFLNGIRNPAASPEPLQEPQTR